MWLEVIADLDILQAQITGIFNKAAIQISAIVILSYGTWDGCAGIIDGPTVQQLGGSIIAGIRRFECLFHLIIELIAVGTLEIQTQVPVLITQLGGKSVGEIGLCRTKNHTVVLLIYHTITILIDILHVAIFYDRFVGW